MEANMQYPAFSAWYGNLFTDDMRLKPEREIIVCEKEYEIAGVTILKSTKEESKICTMYVAEQYRHNGLGRRLMELSLEWLENDKPVITLDKSKEPDFAGILKHFGFVLQEENCGLYNPGKVELIYNGKNWAEGSVFFVGGCGKTGKRMEDEKKNVAECREAEICSVRKAELRREMFAGWRREKLTWRSEDIGLCKEARWK